MATQSREPNLVAEEFEKKTADGGERSYDLKLLDPGTTRRGGNVCHMDSCLEKHQQQFTREIEGRKSEPGQGSGICLWTQADDGRADDSLTHTLAGQLLLKGIALAYGRRKNSIRKRPIAERYAAMRSRSIQGFFGGVVVSVMSESCLKNSGNRTKKIRAPHCPLVKRTFQEH